MNKFLEKFLRYLPGIIGGVVLIGSGIAIFSLGYDLPIYGGFTLSAVMSALGLLAALWQPGKEILIFAYATLVLMKTGKEMEHLPQGLEIDTPVEPVQPEPVNHPEIPETSNSQGIPDSSPEVKP